MIAADAAADRGDRKGREEEATSLSCLLKRKAVLPVRFVHSKEKL